MPLPTSTSPVPPAAVQYLQQLQSLELVLHKNEIGDAGCSASISSFPYFSYSIIIKFEYQQISSNIFPGQDKPATLVLFVLFVLNILSDYSEYLA